LAPKNSHPAENLRKQKGFYFASAEVVQHLQEVEAVSQNKGQRILKNAYLVVLIILFVICVFVSLVLFAWPFLAFIASKSTG
jgi:preprotein translocase subunit SecF